MENKPDKIATLIDHADFAAAVPTTEHFLPLLYATGISAASQHPRSR